jgi:DNA-directed RNA polymerase specialized sigma24 family protein
VRIVNDGADFYAAPKDYAELFSKYYDFVVNLVRRMGIDESRKEDVASEILLRFYERDFLNEFDPTMTFEYQGEIRPARFKSFLSKFVLAYVRGHWDKQRRLHTREVLIVDSPIAVAGHMFGHQQLTWIDVHGDPVPSSEEDIIAELNEQELVDDLRRHLKTIPRRSRFDTCDLPALFDAVVAQIRATGTWDVAVLRAQFGVSSTAMHSWMWWLRGNLSTYLGESLPAKRPRTVKPKPAPHTDPSTEPSTEPSTDLAWP